VDQTRIHLDTVTGLGQFIELEVVLGEGQNDEQGRLVAETLMAKLEINPEDLVEGAYMDLLESG
jgi:adenylate cyclase class IV